MTNADIERLKADASGNTGLSAVLAEAVEGFSGPADAVRFLASRGFEVTAADLAEAAADAPDQCGLREREGHTPDGYATLIRFLRDA